MYRVFHLIKKKIIIPLNYLIASYLPEEIYKILYILSERISYIIFYVENGVGLHRSVQKEEGVK